MQRMFNLDKWTRVTANGGLVFKNDRPRNVRLDVNAPIKTALHIVDGDGVAHFLALVEGRDTVEFGVDGAFELVSDGDVNVYTADGADISFRLIDPKILTKIAQRRSRNPELELMQRIMLENVEKRIAAATIDMERRYLAAGGAGSGSIAGAVVPPPVAPQTPASEPEPSRVGEAVSEPAGGTPVEPAEGDPVA